MRESFPRGQHLDCVAPGTQGRRQALGLAPRGCEDNKGKITTRLCEGGERGRADTEGGDQGGVPF